MTAGVRKDPYGSYQFLVELDGLVVAGFSEVSGLQSELETEPYWEGGLNSYSHKLVKTVKSSNLILKRGMTDSDALWTWYTEAASGMIKRRNGSIILLGNSGDEAWRWNFVQAIPVRWQGPDFRSDVSATAFETLELAHNGISKD